MKPNLNLRLLIVLLMLFTSCEELIEKDVSKAELNILGPVDGYRSARYDITFWWDEVKGAQKYRLQIVRPRFDSLEQIILDTATSENKMLITLFPGKYQWRLRVENSGSHSGYVTRNLSIDTNMDFSGQNFPVDYPVNGFITGKNTVSFSWQGFPFADSYDFVLADSNQVPVETTKVTQTTISRSLDEGTYTWKVRAINSMNSTMSEFSTIRIFQVDTTRPTFPFNISPQDGTILSNPVHLTWTRDVDAYGDSILIGYDSLFSTITHRYYTKSIEQSLPELIVDTTYYWKIKSIDRAGNWSAFSPCYRFTINP